MRRKRAIHNQTFFSIYIVGTVVSELYSVLCIVGQVKGTTVLGGSLLRFLVWLIGDTGIQVGEINNLPP